MSQNLGAYLILALNAKSCRGRIPDSHSMTSYISPNLAQFLFNVSQGDQASVSEDHVGRTQFRGVTDS